MKQILVIGAGRSSIFLIDYLIDHAQKEGWELTVADADSAAAERLVNGRPFTRTIPLDAEDDESLSNAIAGKQVVISMLPAAMHIKIAKQCIAHKINLITPSYISDAMRSLEGQVKASGLSFLNELGVDPGIDHMSAMRLINRAKDENAEVTCFESFTGGLIAPESDDNPWNYKFTWNPRNVVLAGQGGAVKFKHNGRFKYIPYQKLFRRTEVIDIPDYGQFEGYANRDSLGYRELYGLNDVPTIYRGTLRRRGFCRAWNIFVQMGMTDDSFKIEDAHTMTHREFTNSFLAYNPDDSVELKLMHYLKLDQDGDIMDKLSWLGIFDDEPIGLKKPSSPAEILQAILEKKWSLKPDDKDMIVMWHKIRMADQGAPHHREFHSSMVVIGDAQPRTAMAKTVGLPVAIAARLLLNGTITMKGVVAPVYPEIYDPILDELEGLGINFVEREIALKDQKPT